LAILIAGGGIGGLTAALALAHQGVSVRVFEQAAGFEEAGAGIQISPNSSRILHHLGLEDALRPFVFLPEAAQVRHWRHGKTIAQTPLGAAAQSKYGAPYYHIHRADLLRVLVEAAEQNPLVSLHTNARVESVSQNPTGVSLTLGDKTYEGEALIGADGIHSAVRAHLWGKQSARFTGNVAWRALVPRERLPADLIAPNASVYWGPGKHFVHYYVQGGAMVNCVCVVEKTGWDVEAWTHPGSVSELAADFAGWHQDIQQLIAAAVPDSLFKWALFDRAPMAQWGKGRVSLLGDACHPMLPFMAQGSAMAIEDGAILAVCLAKRMGAAGDMASALQRYEDIRKPRTKFVQNLSRRNARVFHLRGAAGFVRNQIAPWAGQQAMDRLYAYDALTPSGD
jgi:salicylate hydroxylase